MSGYSFKLMTDEEGREISSRYYEPLFYETGALMGVFQFERARP